MVDQNRQYLKMIHELSKQVAERDKLINKYEQHASKINELILAEQDKSNKLKKKLKDKKKWELIMLGAIGALTGLLIFSG